jgi:phosphoheptose isomerase
MPYPAVDLTRVRTYPLPKRQSRVALGDLVLPGQPAPAFENPELPLVAQSIAAARQSGRPVIWCFGAHVIKRGLAPLLIDLVQRGVITHLASNGAATIHDFEIALQGTTSEDVAASLADGSFGMAEETGSLMNRAIQAGARDGLGIGEALGRLIVEDPRFAYRDYSILAAAYRQGIPYTVHVALGTDIIHQHPEADFSAIGWGSGQDFKIFSAGVCGLEGGVFCNFGSAVIGPEVFLKAVSIARNLGNPLKVFTTANFDLVELGDYRAPIGDDRVDYYYRPRKNIVNRPVALGGKGYHISGDHLVTVPNLHHAILALLSHPGLAPAGTTRQAESQDWRAALEQLSPRALPLLKKLVEKAPELEVCAPDVFRTFRLLARSFDTGATLYLCGNGGSMSDALHISGELTKSFRRARHLPPALQARLSALPGGAELAAHLQAGLRAVPLGANLALASAVLNDNPLPSAGYAQELLALARPGDVLLAISTSGKARNCLNAALTAHAIGVSVISLTGQAGGPLAEQADIAIRAPAQSTADVQELHIQLYHALCAMLEDHFFGEIA